MGEWQEGKVDERGVVDREEGTCELSGPTAGVVNHARRYVVCN